jgi:type VI secretion system protein VasD
MNYKRLATVFAVLSLVLTLIGCGEKITLLDLEITADKDNNPDNIGIPSPLVLHFYELAEADRFSKLDFWALTKDPAKQLSDNLVSHAKFVIVPNQTHKYKIRLNEKTKYFGVVGNFRNVDKDGAWRFVKILNLDWDNDIELYINKYSIEERY